MNTLQQTCDEIIKDVIWGCQDIKEGNDCSRCIQNIGDQEVICLLEDKSKNK